MTDVERIAALEARVAELEEEVRSLPRVLIQRIQHELEHGPINASLDALRAEVKRAIDLVDIEPDAPTSKPPMQ